jgi:hypothetical protein
MTTRAPARRRGLDSPELDRRIEEAESRAVIVWRGEQVRFRSVPERVTRIDDRRGRDRLYAAYQDALEALNPLYQERLAAWRQRGDLVKLAASDGTDPSALAVSLERFSLNAETPYYAALRRYLALIDIEQGDATEADVWHVVRGSAWAHWFGHREVRRAVIAAGRVLVETGDLDGWRGAEWQLAGQPGAGAPIGPVGSAYASVVGSPEWLADELGVSPEEVAAFADFAAFVRLVRLRRAHAELQYELRLFTVEDAALQRAYYAGIVGHMSGVTVGEAGYLAGVPRPFASVSRLETAILGAMLVEVLESRHGPRWWRDPASAKLAERVGAAETLEHALAELGYDALDWRPVLRQIRTRLIGEMSGYGGPNITTRAGTRKV